MQMVLEFMDRLAGWWIDWRTDQDAKSNPAIQEFGLKRVELTPGGMEILAHAPGVAMLADEAATLLKVAGAPNYVQFDMLPRLDRGRRPVRVTVQWADGKSPAELVLELKQRIAELENRVGEAEHD